jgi:hypothetical protein
MPGTAATTIAGPRRVLLVGMWSAWLFFALSVAYAAATVAAGAARGVPKDPYWAIAEIITIVGAVILVILMAVIHDFARPRGKILTLTTLGWTLVWTGPTGTVYFLQLTVARRIYVQAIPGLARLFGFVHAGDSRAIGRLGLIRNVAVRNWPAHAHLVVSPTTSLR